MKTPILALAAAMLALPVMAMAPVRPNVGPSVTGGISQDNRATMALNALESKGYASFTNFRPDGRNFAADVTKGGKTVHVIVVPGSGTISVQS